MQDPYTHRTNWTRVIGVILLVVGVIALIAGVVYMTTAAHSLPSILGRIPSANYHRTKRGVTSLVVGGVAAVVGGILFARSRRPD